MVNAVLDQLARKLRADEFAGPLDDAMASRTIQSAEDRLIARYFAPLATHPGALGLSDDAAFIKPPPGCDLVLTTDAIVGGVHFFTDDAAGSGGQQGVAGESVRPRRQGRKAARISVVARAAEGNRRRLARSICRRLARRTPMLYDCPLFGGDTVRTPGPIMISVAMFGSVPEGTMVRRAGAKAGRPRFRQRHIGDAALGLALAQGRGLETERCRSASILLSRYLLPQPRNALAEAVRTHAIGGDGCLGRACRRSSPNCAGSRALRPRSRSPTCRCPTPPRPCSRPTPALLETALTGGDDYEIVCTVPPAKAESFRAAAQAAKCAVTEIGDDRSRRGGPLPRIRAARRSPSNAPLSAISEIAILKRAAYNCRINGQGTMDDVTGEKRTAANALTGISPNFEALHKSFPDLGLFARARAAQRAAVLVRIWRHRRRRRYRHRAQLGGVRRHQGGAALRRITTVPPTEVELFGTRYSAPIGIAPMGGPSLVWPGADLLMAKAAQRARVPYTLGVAGGATIEEVAKVAPDVFWLQLYRFYQNDHAIGFDLIKRATAAGVKALALTIDVPVRTTRTRESYAGLGREFRPNLRMIYEMITRPKWLMALLRHGYPRFATISNMPARTRAPTKSSVSRGKNMGGVFSWEEVARYRDRWKGPMLVKGILHPADAEKAVSLGIEGIWVSNHGGRQIEALHALDRRAAGDRLRGRQKATIVLDSGIRSGQDVMRAWARRQRGLCRQEFSLGGRRARRRGPAHLIDLYVDELRSSLGQIGARSLDEARMAAFAIRRLAL